MRQLSAPNRAAIAKGTLVPRDFLWFVVRDRDTGAPVTDGYWSDVGTIAADVVDPDTGGVVNRTFVGAFGLVGISDIPLVSVMTVQRVTVTLAQCSDRINDLIRAYDCKQGRVQIWTGLFDDVTRALVAPAFVRFNGFIDDAPVRTPAAGEAGDVKLSCTSNTQELFRVNTDTRSDASQRLRGATDNFYENTNAVADWQVNWGVASA